MAILENATNFYYKVDYENSVIKENKVYVSFTAYETEEHRIREKFRIPLIDEMLQRATQYFCEGEMTEEKNIIQNAVSQVYNHCYKYCYVNNDIAFDFSSLKPFGFQDEWIYDPIHIVMSGTVCTQDFEPQRITTEYLYNNLKTVLPNDITSC